MDFNINDFNIQQYKSDINLQAYKVIYQNESAGKVLIKKDTVEGITGWFLSIELNRKSRNKGIGKVSLIYILYKYHGKDIYANVRKSNKPSIKILELLNFEVLKTTNSGQLIYKYVPVKYNINILLEINWERYYKTVFIDLMVYLANPSKKAVRIPFKKEDYDVLNLLEKFCDINNFYYLSDEAYIIISKLDNVRQIYNVDLSTEKHIKELGQLLGYPECCTSFMDYYEENEIDELEESIKKGRVYEGKYVMIDFSGYYKGQSLISHIPCSSCCNSSLITAFLTGLFIKNVSANMDNCKELGNLELFIDNTII